MSTVPAPPAGSIELDLGLDHGPHAGAGLLIRALDIGDVFTWAGRRYRLAGKPRRPRARHRVPRPVRLYVVPLEDAT